MSLAVASTKASFATPARPLLFLVTIVCAMGALAEFPLRWFVRGGFALGGLAAGLALLSAQRRASPRAGQPLAFTDFRHVVTSACQLLLWCEVATLSLRFLRLNALPYFSWDPGVFDLMWDRRVIVISHITAGVTALLLGPAQFWPAWRTRALTVHRWLGRAYVLAVTVGAGAALYLSWFVAPYEGGKVTGASMAIVALAWLAATTIGWRKAVAHEIARHREWMFRSYLLTLVFVSLRWQLALPFLHRLGPFDRVVPVAVWIAWLVPLTLAELAIRRARRSGESRFL
jgi:uncharacterized membrane protein